MSRYTPALDLNPGVIVFFICTSQFRAIGDKLQMCSLVLVSKGRCTNDTFIFFLYSYYHIAGA